MKNGPKYDHLKIEKKWQAVWKKQGIYKTEDSSKKPKAYVLDMFPYPSGEGLHVGHPKGYIATDIYSRFKRMNGYNVLHPMGWDAFGLPAENYAIDNKINPEISVKKNIKYFKSQLEKIGFDYDWSREINTTDPGYYKWTQWIFLQLLKKGLAYESWEPINWCPSCQTGLANEDLETRSTSSGQVAVCERCGSAVVKKPMRQWVLKITNYANRLLKDLDQLNWPESIKESQRHWIGQSEGVEIEFKLKAQNAKLKIEIKNSKQKSIKVFTTRPDTLFGATYLVVAPEHEIIQKLKIKIQNWKEIETYIAKTSQRSEIERTVEGKEKTGVKLEGVMAINPVNGGEIPIFIADYVLPDYGTSAIMAVPAHDTRDYEFAKKFKLPIIPVVVNDLPTTPDQVGIAHTGPGRMANSDQFNGLDNERAKIAITKFVHGKQVVKYKLRDWVFSRQRYWGEPIPIIHCEKCGVVPVPEKDLPVKLPTVKSYKPTGTGESPLAAIANWVNVKCPICGTKAKRETNTMPQWAGSSWYYLRFIDPKNNKALVDKKKETYWSPVDMYVGGAEHATRHLIYTRFWHKFLQDIGVVNQPEPFAQLKNQGLISGADGRKMSKRWGNVINPDDVVKSHGADTLRLYEMFMGPFEQGTAWSIDNLMGARRFVEKIWRLASKIIDDKKLSDPGNENLLHKTIKQVTEDINRFNFNTAVSALMILANDWEKRPNLSCSEFKILLKLLAPFAPHLAEELWHNLGEKNSIHLSVWPVADPKKLIVTEIKIVVQINGKVRANLNLSAGQTEETVIKFALLDPLINKWLAGGQYKKAIYIRDKLLNFVV